MNGVLSFVGLAAIGILFALLWVPVSVFSLQVFAARLHQSEPSGSSISGIKVCDGQDGTPRPRLAVLVPAHNEAGGISTTLADVLSQLNEGDRLLVVADNCSDATADVARRCGAEAIERKHDSLRGKGYALDFGLKHLAADPVAVVVIVDADCTLGPGTLRVLAEACSASGRPVQALDLMHAAPGAPLRLRVAAFAWRVKNWIRPLGALRMGFPCPLMGTGMAFPWSLISGAALATGHLVEDMKLGMDLASAGAPPLFVPEARVDSLFPADRKSALAQRARWEHGHLSMVLHDGPRFLTRALATRNPQLVAMALDLLVPPLTLLLGLVVAAVLIGAGLAIDTSSWPLCVAGACLVFMLIALLKAWWLVGRDLLSVGDLLRAPAHALTKFPVYLKFITNRQKDWVRTERNDDKS